MAGGIFAVSRQFFLRSAGGVESGEGEGEGEGEGKGKGEGEGEGEGEVSTWKECVSVLVA